jgi:septum formation protein
MKLVLASASPRRRSLLESVGVEVLVQPPDVDETLEEGESPEAAVVRLARSKAHAVAAEANQVVLAADTVVALGPVIFGKPADREEAITILNRLSAARHDVWTGWCVRRGGEVLAGAVCTAVSFRPLTAAEIEAYVASGEPMDKAGAYAIQGRGGALVDRIEGSYSNVVGLPMAEVLAALRQLAAI